VIAFSFGGIKMSEENKTNGRFMGTYFEPETIFRLSRIAKIFGWVVLIVYALDFLVTTAVMVLQIMRGYWTSMGFTDYASNILMILERPFRGFVYFIVLFGVSEVLKIFVDIEANTRRAARTLPK
jgi:hypothetical protein